MESPASISPRLDGHTWDEVSDRIDCSRGFVASLTRRFTEQRIAGLYSRCVGHSRSEQ